MITFLPFIMYRPFCVGSVLSLRPSSVYMPLAAFSLSKLTMLMLVVSPSPQSILMKRAAACAVPLGCTQKWARHDFSVRWFFE